jgi:hypothetical protein
MYGVREAGVVRPVRSGSGAAWPVLQPGAIWTSDAVVARLERVARFMMFDRVERPSDRGTMQIDVVRSYWETYGREAARLSRVLPSGKEIDQIDEAVQWLFWIERQDDRDLVWARACHVKWRHLERRLGVGERGLRKRHRRLVLGLVLRLNG